jgi:hypothetical protein
MYAALLQVDPNGTLMNSSLYTGLNAWTGFLGGAAVGANNVLYTTAEECLFVDATGAVVTAVAMPNTTFDPFSYRFGRGDLRVHGERVVLTGNLVVSHEDTGFIDDHPEVWSFHPDSLDGCLMERFTPTRTDLPAQDITPIIDSTFISVDAGAISVPDPYHSTVRTPFNTLFTCDLFLSTQAAALPDPVPGFTATLANDILQVRSDCDARLTLFDGNGRVVHDGVFLVHDQMQQLSMAQLGSGLYLLRSCTTDGTGCRSARVVLTR